ncbi:MAG: hypothetical protein ACHREM_00415 [Polyangiales bacterium]
MAIEVPLAFPRKTIEPGKTASFSVQLLNSFHGKRLEFDPLLINTLALVSLKINNQRQWWAPCEPETSLVAALVHARQLEMVAAWAGSTIVIELENIGPCAVITSVALFGHVVAR